MDSTEAITVAPLAEGDFEDWEPLWWGYLTFYEAEVAPEHYRLTFGRLTGGGAPMGGFVARDGGGAAVGIVHWITHPSCWTAGDYCYLQDLFVAEGGRGSGTGRALIEAVYAKARERGCARVYWLTHESNAAAMRLYDKVAERSGFVQYRKLLG